MNLMELNSESILALGSAMLEYSGQNSFEYLDISFNQIKQAGIALLSDALFISVRKINIKILNLASNFIGQEGVPHLEDVLDHLSSPMEINISNNQLVEFWDQSVLAMKIFKLDLSNNWIKQIPHNFFTNVVCLNLSNNRIEYEGAYQISQILSSRKVSWVELNLSNNNIGTRGFISLIYGLIDNRTLLSLMVANIKLDGEGILVYIFNHEILSLEFLDLSQNSLRYELVFALLNSVKDCNLRSLSLSSLQSGDREENTNQLFEIKSNYLRELDFSNNRQIISPILLSLSQQLNKIEYLNLNKCLISEEEDIHNFCRFLSRNQFLHTLHLSGNNLGLLTSEQLIQIGNAFTKNQSISYLNLSKNKLRRNCVFFLKGLQNCLNLETLDLSDNQIDDSMSHSFFNLINQTKLTCLKLSRNMIKVQTLQKIKLALEQNKQCGYLNISSQKLTAEDILLIGEIISENDVLRALDISGNLLINKLNNFIFFKNDIKVESLSINKIQFNNQKNFNNFLRVIQNNNMNIRIIEITNTLLSQKQLFLFLQKLQQIRVLYALLMDYQVFISEQVNQILYELFQTFKYLKVLSLKRCQFSNNFFKFLYDFMESSKRMLELDLSENAIPQNGWVLLSKAIGLSQSLQGKKNKIQSINGSNCNGQLQVG